MKRYVLCIILCVSALFCGSCGKDNTLEEGIYTYNRNLDNGREVAEIQVEKREGNTILKLKKERREGNMVSYEFSETEITISGDVELSKTITVNDEKEKNSYVHQFQGQEDTIRWRYTMVKDDNGKKVKGDISSKKYITLKKQHS